MIMISDLYKMCIMRIMKKEDGAMKFREVIKILEDNGWVQKAVRGSHYQYTHPGRPGKITVPCHKGDLDKRTAKSIFTAAGLDTSRLI